MIVDGVYVKMYLSYQASHRTKDSDASINMIAN
jgi:hypothetical protein